jgi:hypothetical protein
VDKSICKHTPSKSMHKYAYSLGVLGMSLDYIRHATVVKSSFEVISGLLAIMLADTSVSILHWNSKNIKKYSELLVSD